jgi:hypothetical protein
VHGGGSDRFEGTEEAREKTSVQADESKRPPASFKVSGFQLC